MVLVITVIRVGEPMEVETLPLALVEMEDLKKELGEELFAELLVKGRCVKRYRQGKSPSLISVYYDLLEDEDEPTLGDILE